MNTCKRLATYLRVNKTISNLKEEYEMKVLITVDMQNDFVNGSLGTKEAVGIVDNVVQLNKKALTERWQLMYTRDTHESNYLDTLEGKKLPVEHCIRGTDGWQLIPELEEFKYCNCYTINKPTFGSYGLLETLERLDKEQGIEEIHICGLCTDICVVSNALLIRATFPNKVIVVHKDCCAGVTPETHNAALEVMKMCQIDVE